MNSAELFQKRMSHSWKEARRILVLISSGSGFPILMGMLLVFLNLAYREFLSWYPTEFPLEFILAILYTPLIVRTKMRTWIKAADMVFLIPMEQRMNAYFSYSLRYTSSIHIGMLLLFFSLAFPVFRLHLGSSIDFLLAMCWLLLLQIGNDQLTWYLLRQSSTLTAVQRWLWYLLRLFLCFWALYTFLKQWWGGVLLCALLFCYLIFDCYRQTPSFPYPWGQMVYLESATRMRYLRWANWFIDLPYEGERSIYPQRGLIRFLRLWERHPTAMSYLYRRSLLRDKEIFPMYIRLNLFFAIAIWFLPWIYLQLAALSISLVLSAIQLADIMSHHRYPIWIHLYPNRKANDAASLIAVLLSIQTLFLVMIGWGLGNIPLLPSLTTLVTSIFLAIVYSYVYLPKRQKIANSH